MFPRSINLSGLNNNNGLEIKGIDSGEFLGRFVSHAGDINSDGIDDIIISGNQTYIIFGNNNLSQNNINLANVDGSKGLMINGVLQPSAVSDAGDINGDGIDDIIIGDSNNQKSYIVFGNSNLGDSGAITVTEFDGDNGLIIVANDDGFGDAVSRAGDVNGDGIDDIIIGAPFVEEDGAGVSRIIFGDENFGNQGTFKLNELDGFSVKGANTREFSGDTVSSAGDINNDGIDDILIGARNGSKSYVVFGNQNIGDIDLANLDGSNGFVIEGSNYDDFLGSAVSSAGDVNGDGIDDILIGASNADIGEKADGGKSYIIFGGENIGISGKITPSDLNGSNGFVLQGIDVEDFSGGAVSGGGDINHDGIDDIIIGASSADPNNNNSAGETYLVFGEKNIGSNGSLNLAQLNGSNGLIINGVLSGDYSGNAVSNRGDINGDGIDDIVIGAFGVDGDNSNGYETYTGAVYIVFGQNGQQVTNLAPEVDLNGNQEGTDFTVTFANNPVIISKGLSLTDFDNSTLVGAKIRITNYLDSNQEFLQVNTANTNIKAQYNSQTGILNLTGEDSLTNYQKVLRTVSYDNTAPIPDTTDRKLELIINDGKAPSEVVTATINFQGAGIFTANPVVDLTQLDTNDGFLFEDTSVTSVAGIGDINGDGFADVAIGNSGARVINSYYYNSGGNRGQTYIIFGQSQPFTASLTPEAINGNNGFIINGGFQDQIGRSINSLGDINGDGFDDIIIGGKNDRGAIDSDHGNSDRDNHGGQVYVIFGKSSSFGSTFSVEDLNGNNGFVFKSQLGDTGYSLSGGGDVNGDGFDDILIGSPGEYSVSRLNNDDRGYSFVIFGQGQDFASSFNQSFSKVLTIQDQPDSNFRNSDNFKFGTSVEIIGDINGDGFADIAVGSFTDDIQNSDNRGKTYVIFGSRDDFAKNLNLSQLKGDNGFILNGIQEGDRSGFRVADGGDINSDGFNDLIVSAPNANQNNGQVYVIFGKKEPFTANFNLDSLDGSNGFILNGNNKQQAGEYISSGDINGDGFSDIVVGTDLRKQNKAYVVFGKAEGFTKTLDLAQLDGHNGITFQGQANSPLFSESETRVAVAGDINHDGVDDLIIGDPEANSNQNNDKGETYLVFGNAAPTIHFNNSITSSNNNLVAITPNLTIQDKNDHTLIGATITITNLSHTATEILTVDAGGTNITANYNPTTGTLLFTGEDTITNYQQVLRTVQYQNTDSQPDKTNLDLEFMVADDGTFNNTSAVTTLSISLKDIINNPDNDFLNGTIAGETIQGQAGNDTIRGLGGNDNLLGGDGQDSLNGNQGNDSLFGGKGDDTLRGNRGNDIIQGNSGRDYIFGDKGNDVIVGGLGNDTLVGGAGGDRLDGGIGNDSLFGGMGADQFVIQTQAGHDIIVDYRDGVDKIILANNLQFGQISIVQNHNSTEIRLLSSNDVLVSLNSVNANDLNSEDFLVDNF